MKDKGAREQEQSVKAFRCDRGRTGKEDWVGRVSDGNAALGRSLPAHRGAPGQIVHKGECAGQKGPGPVTSADFPLAGSSQGQHIQLKCCSGS